MLRKCSTISLLAFSLVCFGFGLAAQPSDELQPENGGADAASTGEVLSDLTVDEVVDRLQAFYDGIESFHADFVQIYTNIALADSEESSGRVYFLKPGRMRWDYANPQEKYLISDGESVWIYEPEFNQVATMRLAATDLPSALRFLVGEGVLRDDFHISLEECEREGVYCLRLRSRTGEGDYQYLRFVVDGSEFSVRETVVVDPVGNTNQFIFTNSSTRDQLPPEGFRFTPPPDARIIMQQ